MLEYLQYPFFRNALLGVLIISVAAAVIGTYIVARRLVAISGGVTHACFGGLGLGYYLGFNPVIGAAIVAIASSVGVEWMARRHSVREDSAIAVVWAVGMAIGIFFVFLTPGYVPELNTFLFGNVLTITSVDLAVFALFTALLLIFVVAYSRTILACAFDRDFASVMQMPVKVVSTIMTVMVAVCIVLTIRLVGVMLLMSMLAMPQIIAELFCRRFYRLMVCSVAISLVCCLLGLILSAIVDVPCSALIVMVMTAAYILGRIIKSILRRRAIAASAAAMTALLLTAALSGCSMKKNTAASRNYSAFITRYNIYFNGDEHYKETIASLEKEYQDDYSRLLFMHPAEAFNDEKAPQPATDFKRSIEKAQKAIQLRSIKKRPARKAGKGNDPEYKKWLKREEYNPFLHNAWMMMARSQYLNGDFLGAASTFYYIARHFWWLPATVTEAKLWQARCYCAIDWVFEAETIINSVKPKDIEGNKTLLGLYYFVQADIKIRSKEFADAIAPLRETIKYASSAQKTRLTFLLGQLLERTGQTAEAYKAFKKVGGTSGASYRTKFNARIKQSEVFQGSDIKPEVKALKALTRYGANREYLDQIYYAIGNLYLSRADTTNAVENYEKAIKESTRNGIDKAMVQLTLGAIYYDRQEYEKAQPCYAEALPLIPDNYPDYNNLKRRSDVLDELAVYSQNVSLQDSLLRLAAMTPEQQREVVDKIIADLKKREKEEAEAAAREEYLAQQAAAGTGLQQNGSQAPSTFTLNTDKSWYFYNESTRNAGRTEFQKRWGSRRLEDDWRRRNKASFGSFGEDSSEAYKDEEDEHSEGAENADGESSTDSADAEAAAHATDPHYPEYYLNQIPKTDLEIANSKDIIQDGLYNMGLILKDKMLDYPAAETEWNRLLTLYPDNVFRLDVYYNMYLMYQRADNLAEAEKYRQLILSDFPDSQYGQALADPDYMEKLRRMPEVEQALYDRAYEAYINNDNTTVHSIYAQMRADYPMSRIMPKFMFIDALAYVTDNNPEKFAEVLRELTERYPETDVSPLASSYLKLLGEGRKFNTSGSNVRGIVWSTRLGGSDSTAVSMSDAPAEFDFETDGPQLMLLIYARGTVAPNQLIFDVARFNFTSFMVRDFDLEQMDAGSIGMLIVSGFNDQSEVIHYRNMLEKSADFKLPKQVVPLIISKHNFDLLINEGRTLEEYFDAAGDKRLEQIHESVLPPDEYPSDKEMYQRPDDSEESSPTQQPVATPEAQSPTQPQAQPSTHPEAKPESQPKAHPEEEEPYDIPVPVVPVGRPPVPQKVSEPGAKTNRYSTEPQYPSGSEGDDPLLD